MFGPSATVRQSRYWHRFDETMRVKCAHAYVYYEGGKLLNDFNYEKGKREREREGQIAIPGTRRDLFGDNVAGA